MKILVNKGEKRFDEVANETIKGLLFRIDTNQATLSIADLNKFRISIFKKLDGVKTLKLIPESFKLGDLISVLFANEPSKLKVLLENKYKTDVSADGFILIPFNFGTNMVLKNGETLYIEVENAGLVDIAKTCVITIETAPSVGLPVFVPIIELILLDNDRTSYDEAFGSSVLAIASPDLSDLVRATISSDKLNHELTETSLRSQLVDKQVLDPYFEQDGCLFIIPPVDATLNNVRLKLDFDSAKSRSIFVVRRVTSPMMIANVMKKSSEHQKENLMSIQSNAVKFFANELVTR